MMTTAEVAKKYNLTIPTVWQAVVEGRIPSTSIPWGARRSIHLIDPADAEERWGGTGPRPGPKPRSQRTQTTAGKAVKATASAAA